MKQVLLDLVSWSSLIKIIIGMVIAPVLYYLAANIFFFFKTGELRSSYINEEIRQYISNSFPDQYQIELMESNIRNFGEPAIVVFANDKRIKNYCGRILDTKEEEELLPPIVRIYEKRSDLFFKIFPYLPPYESVFELKPQTDTKGNLFIWDKTIEDIDGDGNKEIAIKIITAICGSGGEVFHFILGIDKSRYSILATLPDVVFFEEQKPTSMQDLLDKSEFIKEAIDKDWKPKSLFEEKTILDSGEKITIRSATTDDFIEFKDLDNDGIKEFVVAKLIWKENECHWCPHNWIIAVYKYRNKGFNIDNKFNSSLLLITEEKYNLSDIHGYKPLPNNILGLIPQYYGLFNGSADFDYRERTVSKIFQEIGKHYNNK